MPQLWGTPVLHFKVCLPNWLQSMTSYDLMIWCNVKTIGQSSACSIQNKNLVTLTYNLHQQIHLRYSIVNLYLCNVFNRSLFRKNLFTHEEVEVTSDYDHEGDSREISIRLDDLMPRRMVSVDITITNTSDSLVSIGILSSLLLILPLPIYIYTHLRVNM